MIDSTSTDVNAEMRTIRIYWNGSSSPCERRGKTAKKWSLLLAEECVGLLYGVVDRALFLEKTNRPSAIRWSMKMGGSPSEKPETYRRADVLLSIDKVHTPLLVMHGQNDPQVPPAESARFVEALHAAHKPVFYFTYAGELHGFAQPAHRLDAWEKQKAFLDHYLAPKQGLTSTSTEEVIFPGATVKGASPSTVEGVALP